MSEFIDLERLFGAARPADAPVALRDGQMIDFAMFQTRAAQWRDAFARVDGDRVALYFEDSAEFAAALFGAWHAGKQAVLPADVLLDTQQRLSTLVAAVAGDWPATTAIPRVNVSDHDHAKSRTWRELDAATIALHVFTSGSTGVPSLISKRFGQLSAEARALEACFGAHAGHGCVYATVTHQHLYGLSFRVLWPLASGRPFAAQRMVFPEDLVAALDAARDAVLIASPAHLKRLPEQLDWTQAQSALTAVFSSGGPLPDDALPLADRLFKRRPFEVYGSSETGAIAWRQRCGDASASSSWQALPGMQTRIADENLQLRAAWLDSADWETSADLVAATENGFELLGRADRIVKIEEKRVSLDAIERALCESGLVTDARALVLPGERTRIGVVALPSVDAWQLHDARGRGVLIDLLRRVLADGLEAVALPRHWRFPWALPSNATGKTTQAALLALFDPRRPHARLLERSAEVATLLIDVAANSPYFDGHFADVPILAGVTQIDWSILFARELFAVPGEFVRIDALKFHHWIGAGARIQLSLRCVDGVIAFQIQSDAGAHASGRIVFKALA